MFDFLMIATRSKKRGFIEIYPKFVIRNPSNDLMIRGGDFYAVWNQETKLWSTNEQDVIDMVDRELDIYAEQHKNSFEGQTVYVAHMWDAESGMIDSWHKFCQKQMRDQFHMLDEKLIFSNMDTKKRDFASKKLSYPLEQGDYSAYDRLMSVLYSEPERRKIEWAIGSIISGDSRKLQKFMVLYGAAGTGKSTVLNIIQMLFDGYYSVFDAKALGSSSNSFALEAFKSNPLVAIQHDGDLSRIEDNTRINSLVAHEMMTVNEKFKATYSNRFKCFIFMGTNKPVKITDAKSGLIRRLIDVSPSGEKLSSSEYRSVMKKIEFELGAIAYHCQEVYLDDPSAYDDYIPTTMLGASNDFYNFVQDSFSIFEGQDETTLKAAWELYRTYCDEAKVPYPYSQRAFKEELKNYFWEYKERMVIEDGTRVRNYYCSFRKDRFEPEETGAKKKKETLKLELNYTTSLFDILAKDYPAQYATEDGVPMQAWSSVISKLSDLNTRKEHYVKVPSNHIVIDFDIKDSSGKKSREKNLEEAAKWPATYAEFSRGGAGVHLHYIYTGDPTELQRVYAEDIEIKVFTGDSSLRRKLSKCNDIPIATINSGLPLKEKKVVNFEGVKTERALRSMLRKNLNKEYHGDTNQSVQFIFKILDDAYKSGISYDVSNMYGSILAFAASSTNHAKECMRLVDKMHFKSEDKDNPQIPNDESKPIIFFDTEVFPNLFMINWKFAGEGKKVVHMINPKPKDISALLEYRLIGFNCRRYDNHMLYARLVDPVTYDEEGLYRLSQQIINGSKNAMFSDAYDISYVDVYDMASKKQSLKKWEIELGILHKELGLPWDKPVPEELWGMVSDYCDNDVIATEAVFNHLREDWEARKTLSRIAKLFPNSTTNMITQKIIFGNDRNPQSQFDYRDLGGSYTTDFVGVDGFDSFTIFDKQGRPIFPGYVYDAGKSIYRDEEVGEGGYVYSEPGIYYNVALLDIASMHPSSIVAENLFGDKYTQRFKELLDARIAIKHKDYDGIKNLLGGAFSEFASDPDSAARLSKVLKIPINSVYGLTAAGFSNPFKDPRNVDNIVAKRGALFMVNLKHEVQKRGFTVAHIKTDSIKIPDATPEIIQFVMDYGKMYGYTFEHEETYSKMCLVNDAVYIAKYQKLHNDIWWTATGTQFQIPYVFKKLFSKEPIGFSDICETKSVSTAIYLWDGVEEHEKQFVGKVGLFTPVKKECGGKILLRESKSRDGTLKYDSVSGAKGYYWLESADLDWDRDHDIFDFSYHNKLVDEAIATISKYGDFEAFAS